MVNTDFVDRIVAGDARALARGISLVENEHPDAPALLGRLYPLTGRAHVCGVTGPPGAGKSTLVQRLSVELRQRGKRVAIVAVDPSSPFTGGALLGDRLRMDDALRDAGVFMRSLANRGQVGGLSSATADTVAVIDAAGYDVVIVETVGAGQSEVEIMRLAQTTVVVSVPGLGDDIQAEKAGILEIADIYVVNKADREGAQRVTTDLQRMIALAHMGKPGVNHWASDGPKMHRMVASVGQDHLVRRFGSAEPGAASWRPPVVQTVATGAVGTTALVDQLLAHRGFLDESGRWTAALRARAEDRVRQLVGEAAARIFFDAPLAEGTIESVMAAVAERTLDPHTAAVRLLPASAVRAGSVPTARMPLPHSA